MTRRTLALTTPADRQIPFAEFVSLNGAKIGHWRVWKNFNKDATAGTFFEFHSDGSVYRITIGPDGNIAETVTILQEL